MSIDLILGVFFVLVGGLSYRFIRGVDEHQSYGWPKWVATILGKYTWCFLVGLAHAAIAMDWVYLPMTTLGLALLVGPGWSFLAIHGDRDPTIPDDYPAVRSSAWFTFLINWHQPTNQIEKRLYGLLWMSCRGLYILPLAVAYAIYSSSFMSLFYGIITGALMGVVYFISGYKYDPRSVGRAEMAYGFVLMTFLLLVR